MLVQADCLNADDPIDILSLYYTYGTDLMQRRNREQKILECEGRFSYECFETSKFTRTR